MSNALVGSTYQKIIDDVVRQSETTFEEEGVTRQTLDELRKVWQTKLSGLKVASFPWDPPPVQQSPQAIPSNSTVPSNVPRLPNSNSTANSASNPALNGLSGSGVDVRVKKEPNDPDGYASLPALPANFQNNIAAQRAAQALSQKYGHTAQSQIAQLQAQGDSKHSQPQSTGQPSRPVGAPGNVQLPTPQNSEQARREYAERQRQQQAQQLRNMQAQSQQRQQAPTQQPTQRPTPLGAAQMDGAAEWDAYVTKRRLAAADSHKVDATLRQQLEETSSSMEGGGFMAPLAQGSTSRRSHHPPQPTHCPSFTTSTSNALIAAQVDGPTSNDFDDIHDRKHKGDPSSSGMNSGDEEEDVDAITSDLDDPDDNNIVGEEEEEENGQIMVCTYDKVARVKNKWKCTLKDGVLTTGGKEYIFHKGTGEFEW